MIQSNQKNDTIIKWSTDFEIERERERDAGFAVHQSVNPSWCSASVVLTTDFTIFAIVFDLRLSDEFWLSLESMRESWLGNLETSL